MNLKPQKTKVHLFKFMVNCFFSHFYQVCISKRFFHSRSSHSTFGSDCTVCAVLLLLLLLLLLLFGGETWNLRVRISAIYRCWWLIYRRAKSRPRMKCQSKRWSFWNERACTCSAVSAERPEKSMVVRYWWRTWNFAVTDPKVWSCILSLVLMYSWFLCTLGPLWRSPIPGYCHIYSLRGNSMRARSIRQWQKSSLSLCWCEFSSTNGGRRRSREEEKDTVLGGPAAICRRVNFGWFWRRILNCTWFVFYAL